MLPVPSFPNADLIGSDCLDLLVPSYVFRGLCFPRTCDMASRLHCVPFSVLWQKLWQLSWYLFLFIHPQAFSWSFWLSFKCLPALHSCYGGETHLSEAWAFLPPLPFLSPWTPSLFSPLSSFFCFLVAWVLIHLYAVYTVLWVLVKHNEW